MMRRTRVLALLLVLVAPMATAQPATAPSILAAEQAFERGLRAFQAGQFEAAHEAFVRAATQFEYHQRTTAALLMAGKARYAAGDFEGATSAMTTLIATYPRSRYVPAARELRREAMARLRARPERVAVISIGIALPLADEDAIYVQPLFNGIRLAIERHNAAHPERPVRMVFRDSGGSPAAAADAVSALAREGVSAIIGPLYSPEALAAADVAERLGVVLLAPLATDEGVSRGRRYVFQANPTFARRGTAMAEHALAQGYDRVGIVAVSGTVASEMAEAFRSHIERGRGTVAFDVRLPLEEAWFQLAERLDAGQLRRVDAVYFPLAGLDAEQHAAAALHALDALLGEEASRPRVLGNSEWQHLGASRARAMRYETVFTQDFQPSRSDAEQADFAERYARLAGGPPDRLAFKGYDVAQLLLAALEQARGGHLAPVLRQMPAHQGLGHRIHFAGEQVNQHLFVLPLRDSDAEALR